MILNRTLSAEWLKLRRTLALKMVVIAPVAVVLLTLFMASQAPFSTLRRGTASVDAWPALARVNLQFWGLLMLPLYCTLQTALLAGLDHSENQWKALFARPVPRWNWYAAKMLMLLAMIVVSTIILVLSIVGEGLLLGRLTSEVVFPSPVPLARIASMAAQMTALGFLPLSLQMWVSLRWRSFSVAIGFGALAIVTSFAMLLAAGPYGAWPQYFPWALPMLAVARQATDLALVMGISSAIAVAVTIASCIDFCRREVA